MSEDYIKLKMSDLNFWNGLPRYIERTKDLEFVTDSRGINLRKRGLALYHMVAASGVGIALGVGLDYII